MASVGDALAGWVLLRRTEPWRDYVIRQPLQTHVRFRGLGVGAALMRRLPEIAREEMGLERLRLAVRAGLGLEDFYRGSAGPRWGGGRARSASRPVTTLRILRARS
ncbi:GNAT family N-acetyltransferase [Streptomyces sp. DHE17-7]|uniref:GNAT family N-acetyltransferase n=1 Tax=Streptomyces sp. DHE17-7 TaxID=2759949 RepID=UPI0022EB0DB1|nr:GNAT family N-acetyltransferase [Streptomyces sp. DHE17-7]